MTTREAAFRESHVKENDVMFKTIGSSDNAANTYVINEVISKAKANNSTNPEQPFFQRKKSCPGWDLNPRLSAF